MRKDIALGADYALQVEDGDFVIAASDAQHVQLIVDLHKGNLKQYPLTGVGKERFINGVIDGALRAEIQRQLEGDGYRAKEIRFVDKQLIINV